MMDSDGGKVLGIVLPTVALALFIGWVLGLIVTTNDFMKTLGTKGESCFANNTCRTDLQCLHGDGHEPGTCVGFGDGQ